MTENSLGTCDNCGRENEQLIPWVGEGSAMDFIHGAYALWCERCVLDGQIEHCQKAAANLPGLLRRREALGE